MISPLIKHLKNKLKKNCYITMKCSKKMISFSRRKEKTNEAMLKEK